MAFLRTSNPALKENIFQNLTVQEGQESMTIRGTLVKTCFLLLMVLCSSVYSWGVWAKGMDITPYVWGGMIGGLILAVVIIFKKEWAGYLAPAYCLFEGLFLGAISAMFNYKFASTAPYIVLQAVVLTFGVAIAMLTLYSTRIIKVTDRFRMMVFSATMGIFFFYLIAMALRWFGVDIPFLHQGTTIGIVFSLFVVAIAALNLTMDFDLIEQGANAGAPKYMEWYASFGLMVTLIWLYIEILRLLAKLYSRR